MLKFNVPFIPDIDYTAFLNKHKEFIYSCHFSLYNSEIPDARHKNGRAGNRYDGENQTGMV